MDESLLRQLSALAAVLTFLLNEGGRGPLNAAALSGTIGVVVFGLLAVVTPVVRRLADLPPSGGSAPARRESPEAASGGADQPDALR